MAAHPEENPASGAQYERQGGEGTLVLRGAVDIFEAQAFYTAALQAGADDEAAAVRLDSAGVQRLDLSALQILAALRRDLEAAGRRLVCGRDACGPGLVGRPGLVGGPEAAAARAGLSLCGQDSPDCVQAGPT